MRCVESLSSATRSPAVSVAATHFSAFGVAGPASAATCSSHATSTPAAASGSASSHGAGTPRSSSASCKASSASAASSAAERRATRRAVHRLLMQRQQLLGLGALDAGLDERAQGVVDDGSARPSWSAARWAAAAGLLSSCASPAAILPSSARRSRFCSMSLMRRTTGAMFFMTRACTAGCDSASRLKSSGATRAIRQFVSACIRTPIGASVSAAIAPIHVGAVWRPTGSGRSPSRR